MPKVLIIAIVSVFISSTALAGELGGGGCFGVERTASTPQSTPTAAVTKPAESPTATTAQTPIPKTTKPESKG